VFEHVHNDECIDECHYVREESHAEIRAFFRHCGLFKRAFVCLVKEEHSCNEEARNGYVTKTEKRETSSAECVGCEELIYNTSARDEDFDRGVELANDRDHDVCAKHPEDVVDESAKEEQSASQIH